MATQRRSENVTVGGHVLRLSNLDKVLYPETGTTKRDVLAYYAAVAAFLLPHVEGRPATRKRWVDGVDGPVFFEKNLPDSAPDRVARRRVEHRDHGNDYPLVDDLATLTWLGQVAALEIHVPQWRFGTDGEPLNPDRLVLDLDPGEGVGLAECVFVAQQLREVVTGMGLEVVPVTSGSKGIHLYAALDGRQTSDEVSAVAHELARAMEADHPDLVLSTMGKQDRRGKVFLDWSQNSANKTTIAPYSLRGRSRPTVAAPRTWRELASRSLRQLEYPEVLRALKRRGDPLAGTSDGARPDRLATYRSKRDATKTSEPVPDERPRRTDGHSFVIQEHHARALHWDFRLEHDGVLVSWALPKGEPQDARTNHLAVQTEDHPLEYGTFEGTIARGEYGAGTVSIWDEGSYDLEKWRDGEEIIVVLHGTKRGTRRLALLHTARGSGASSGRGAGTWLLHRMKGDPVAPMLATSGTPDPSEAWSYEMKWDGLRAVATVHDGHVSLASRNGHDLTASYPELQELAARLRGAEDAVLDGEIVAVDAGGRPDFGLLQQRMKATRPRDLARLRTSAPVRLLLFDALELDGRSLLDETYDARRAALEGAIERSAVIDVPPATAGEAGDDGGLEEALDLSRTLGLEGVVAKRRDSTYASGRRSRAWLKLKHQRTQEVVIGGWRPGSGRREGSVGSLLMGVPEEGGLRYVGRVGTGFTDRALDDLLGAFRRSSRKTSPFTDVPAADARDAQWITPSRVGEVSFAEWTASGRLRQPSWRGWRTDKEPGDVAVEGEPGEAAPR
ncbi:hypothetical protein AS850_12985 [Frondihabitans sp. 762G35]|uniref:ATP-dependent DNA ligase n=1 Tax=Frondihabitans sp. 762G35 TaxID=1446794 RepID=UPI000D22AC2D|nr:ATP-dependent DNA ligase [Frondihabitans sp. 762G35]ARC57993.1 hypothetical protein AS850_12985 [Frondihabitans sp. 762G35]